VQAELYGAMSALDKTKAQLVEITLPRPSTAGFNADPRGHSLEWTKRRQEMLKVINAPHTRAATIPLIVYAFQTKREQEERFKAYMEDKRRQEREAQEMNSLIDTFEMNLKSTKSYL
jgi:hypothetical protein